MVLVTTEGKRKGCSRDGGEYDLKRQETIKFERKAGRPFLKKSRHRKRGNGSKETKEQLEPSKVGKLQKSSETLPS